MAEAEEVSDNGDNNSDLCYTFRRNKSSSRRAGHLTHLQSGLDQSDSHLN